MNEAVTEAIRFRQAMARTGRRIAAAGDRPSWFFGVWQPESVVEPDTGARIAFADASPALLATESACWELDPIDDWHGFTGLSEGQCLLDPVKMTLTCPGVHTARNGQPMREVR
ncbi:MULTISPECIES: hypothetical protein [unclassified Streptomyces]|uniref:hypothetical protein n=1 Tax=unclassified Streptomyces TaxID=2593676 RepID=UPI0033D012EE